MHIEHVAMWAKDLERLKAFYERYFEAQAGAKYTNAMKHFTSYFLTFASGARLELMHMPTIPLSEDNVDQQFTGLIHLAFSTGSVARVDALTEQLRLDGYRIVGEPRWTGDGYYESVVLDPEDNRIEITV